jgi:hypothetical protein
MHLPLRCEKFITVYKKPPLIINTVFLMLSTLPFYNTLVYVFSMILRTNIDHLPEAY